MNRRSYDAIFFFLSGMFLLASCKDAEKGKNAFDVLESGTTGLAFSNTLTPLPELNMLKYMYFYNGAGVGAGDFNNDGRTDLFFAGNQVRNRMYLNEGNLHFKDITEATGIPDDGGWSTGVSVIDINNDGLLDIYVCRVAKFAMLHHHNLLLVCKGISKDGIPSYEDQSAAYGLDFSGFSTQAAFLDYDGDGDLDMYLLNHSLRYNSTFQPRVNYENTVDSLSGDRLYRNDGKHFTDVSKSAGIMQSVIGYGLGVCVSDINLDGLPDIYVANDFHENDYLYINQGNGKFTDKLNESIMHTSQFSMGVDVADINNDVFPEIITLDMLPEDPYILKRSLGEDEYNLFRMKLQYGYNYQYTRNNLQLNRRNGMFSEIGFYAGVAATDWSWSPLWMDFDNDGRKDLFISNGIPKRLNDIDYVNYISNEQIQARIRSDSMTKGDLDFIEKFPQIKLQNKFFGNGGDLRFRDLKNGIGNNKPTYSNGAVYADLDNDGDLDIVVNNIGEPAFLYRNNADNGNSVQVNLAGPAGNRNALGSRVLVYSGGDIRSYEKYPVRGFQSSMEEGVLVGLGAQKPDSAFIVWPDKTFERLDSFTGKSKINMNYRKGLPVFSFSRLQPPVPKEVFADVTAHTGLDYLHRENEFVEFNREPLLPFMISSEGPALAVGDMNRDGLEDLFIGASKEYKPGLFIQNKEGKFLKLPSPALDADSLYEDVDAAWTDLDGDGFADLVVASGGNEFYGKDEHLLPRIYMNKGGLKLVRQLTLPEVTSTLSCVLPFDFNGDGKTDLFFGGRAVPFEYGAIPSSYIFINDVTGKFTDATSALAPEMTTVGMVKDAVMADVDGDGVQDMVVAMEWGGVIAFLHEGRNWIKRTLLPVRGWWNCIKAVDIDNDGDLDFFLGNAGENSRLNPTVKEPVRLYYDDFDGNGKKDQVLSYYLDGKEMPFANKAELEKQMPFLKKKFLYAEDFAKASMDDIFERGKLNKALVLTAETFSSSILINEGGMKFTLKPLPAEAQFSVCRDAAFMDYNHDGLKDIWLGSNFYGTTIPMGRSDADFGTLLLNQGKGNMKAINLPGLIMKGETRRMEPIKAGGINGWVLARNNDSARIVTIKSH